MPPPSPGYVFTQVEIEEDKILIKDYMREQLHFRRTLPKLCAKLVSTQCMKSSSLKRLHTYDKARFLIACNDNNILELMKIICEAHMYMGASRQEFDVDACERKWVTWGLLPGQSLQLYYSNYCELLRLVLEFKISGWNNKKKMRNRFLGPLKKILLTPCVCKLYNTQ